MALKAAEQAAYRRRMRSRILRCVRSYRAAYGCAPTLRVIRETVGAASLATVSRYLRELTAEGLLEAPEKRQSAPQAEALRRKCVRTRDGSVIYLDCRVVRAADGSPDVQVAGWLDLCESRQSLSPVTSCTDAEET